MFRKYLKTIVFISIGVSSLILYFWHPSGHPHAVRTPNEKTTRQRPTTREPFQSQHVPETDTFTDDQTTNFYRTLIDNNLFRPLGWTPQRPKETYRLLGTLIPTDGKHKAQAIVQHTATRQTHTVTLGDTLGTDTTVVDIQPKLVTLKKAGGPSQKIHLTQNPLLK